MKYLLPAIIIAAAIVVAALLNRKKEEDTGIELEFWDDSAFDNFKIKGESLMLKMNTTSKPVKGRLSVKDRKGFPTTGEAGTQSYSSSDESVFTVEEDPNDENKFTVTPVGPGVAQLDFEVDADRGEGVKTLRGFVAVEVQAGEATGFGVEFDAVEEEVVSDNTTTQSGDNGPGNTTQAETTDTTTQAEQL